MHSQSNTFIYFKRTMVLFFVYWPAAIIGSYLGSFLIEYPWRPDPGEQILIATGMPFVNMINVPLCPLEELATFRMQSYDQRSYGIAASVAASALVVTSTMFFMLKKWHGIILCCFFVAAFTYNFYFLASSALYFVGGL